MRQGHHHLFALDQVLDVGVGVGILQAGAPRVAIALPDLDQLGLEHGQQLLARRQHRQVLADLGRQRFQLLGDLAALQAGQPLQLQGENRLGLGFRQAIGAVLGHAVARFVDQRDQRHHVARRPVAAHQAVARGVGIGGGPDQGDHFVDVGHRHGEPDQRMGAAPRLAEAEDRAPGDDLLAEAHEGHQQVLQRHESRPAAVDRQHVEAEGRLQRRVLVELVQHHVALHVALQLDDDAHALAVALVAQVGDALDAVLLVAHHLGDALDQAGLRNLIGDLGDDDGAAVAARALLDRRRGRAE